MGRLAAVAAAVLVVMLVGIGVVAWLADDRLAAGTGSDPPGQVGVAWDEGLLSPDGARLAVRFGGAADGGDTPCGAWYIGLVAGLLDGLRVTVITIPGPAPANGAACPPAAGSHPRCSEVRLAYPPGGEPVVDGVSGQPRPVRTATADGDLCTQLLAA